MFESRLNEFDLLPDFDWDAEMTHDMQMVVAELGDTDMRLKLVARPDISRRALLEMLDTNNATVVIAVRSRIASLDEHRDWAPSLEPQTPLARTKRWLDTTFHRRPAAPSTSARRRA